jgi:hypothetical protein
MLRRSLLAGGSALLAAPLAPRFAVAATSNADREVLHLLDRLGFGANEADFQHVKAVGIDRYIAEQLNRRRSPNRRN